MGANQKFSKKEVPSVSPYLIDLNRNAIITAFGLKLFRVFDLDGGVEDSVFFFEDGMGGNEDVFARFADEVDAEGESPAGDGPNMEVVCFHYTRDDLQVGFDLGGVDVVGGGFHQYFYSFFDQAPGADQ